MGAKLQSHIPAQVNMGYIFGKKIWVHYTQDLKKKGYIFPEQSLTRAPFPAKMTPNNGYEPWGVLDFGLDGGVRPDLGTLTHV